MKVIAFESKMGCRIRKAQPNFEGPEPTRSIGISAYVHIGTLDANASTF